MKYLFKLKNYIFYGHEQQYYIFKLFEKILFHDV